MKTYRMGIYIKKKKPHQFLHEIFSRIFLIYGIRKSLPWENYQKKMSYIFFVYSQSGIDIWQHVDNYCTLFTKQALYIYYFFFIHYPKVNKNEFYFLVKNLNNFFDHLIIFYKQKLYTKKQSQTLLYARRNFMVSTLISLVNTQVANAELIRTRTHVYTYIQLSLTIFALLVDSGIAVVIGVVGQLISTQYDIEYTDILSVIFVIKKAKQLRCVVKIKPLMIRICFFFLFFFKQIYV